LTCRPSESATVTEAGRLGPRASRIRQRRLAQRHTKLAAATELARGLYNTALDAALWRIARHLAVAK